MVFSFSKAAFVDMALWSTKRAASDDEASVSPDGPASGVHERSREERSLVMRLDFFLMVYGCISQIIKYLDQVWARAP